ncbi:MAG: hypothetical protein WD628_05890 [Thermomicrobiales bacterium]
MNANDHEKRLDEYIDALNAGRQAPPLAEDAELIDLFATASDIQRLRLAEPRPDDVPSRLAAALERELRADPTHATRRIESTDMSRLRDASSNGTIRPPEDRGVAYGLPQRPDRGRQLVQFALAAVAFIIVGIILAQIIGGGTDEPSSAVGTDPEATATTDVVAPDATETATSPTLVPLATPSVSAPDGLPTPDASGLYRLATFDEARELTPFELVEPTDLPSTLELAGILLSTDPNTNAINMVTAEYRHLKLGGDFHFVQTSLVCNDADMQVGMVDAVNDDIEIGGKSIRRTLGTTIAGLPLANYYWQSGDICYAVTAALRDGIDEELVESLVAVIPLPESDGGAEPTEPAVVIEPAFATMWVSPDYVTCEDEVIARGMGFEPGTTVVIYGGPLLGDNFGPVTDDIPVSDNGAFEARVDLSRLIGECGGADIQMDGVSFTLGAETGSSLKEPFDGPSALAVVKFTHNVPDSVKHRVVAPSCGTEVQRAETDRGPAVGPSEESRACFVEAVEAGVRTEFVSFQPTIEGAMLKTIYRSLGDGIVEVIYDTSNDQFGNQGWSVASCTGATLADEREQFAIHLIGCGEPTAIE